MAAAPRSTVAWKSKGMSWACAKYGGARMADSASASTASSPAYAMSTSGASRKTRGMARRIEIRAVAGGDAEVPGQVLEPEAGQIARPGVVQLGQEIGVDDVAPGDLVAAIADRPLRDGELGDAASHGLAAASPRERDAVAAGARLDVLEVEAEDVVALDHVGIALADDAGRSSSQEGGLRQAVAAEDVAESRRVGQGDGDDAIARAARRWGTRSPRW